MRLPYREETETETPRVLGAHAHLPGPPTLSSCVDSRRFMSAFLHSMRGSEGRFGISLTHL